MTRKAKYSQMKRLMPERNIEAEREVDRLQTENAKLRELAQDMLDSIAAEGGWVDEFEDRMRELGIEVEDD